MFRVNAKSENDQLDTNLIKGLVFNEEKGTYTFKRKTYKLKTIIKGNEKFYDTYYFINIKNPEEIVTVVSLNGKPFKDGFNKTQMTSKERDAEFHKVYYKRVYIEKRQKESIKIQKIKAKEKEKIKLQQEKEKAKKLKPRLCLNCGKEFTPSQIPQKFCCDKCRIYYFSKKQAENKKQAKLEKKICPVCGKAFLGNPRDKYCSKDCYLQANKVRKNNNQ